MTDTKAVEEYFELVEELIQTGAKGNFDIQLKINPYIEKHLGMKIFIAVVTGQNEGNANFVEFHFGWEKGDERFSSKKTIISNVEWK